MRPKVRYPSAVPVSFDGFGKILQGWRRATGESRREVQEAARISASSVGRYESGERLPPADELSRLLAHFGRDIYDLADELAAAQGEPPREQPIPMVAINVSADEFPGATRETVAELLQHRRRLHYYEERRAHAQEAINRLRSSLREGRG